MTDKTTTKQQEEKNKQRLKEIEQEWESWLGTKPLDKQAAKEAIEEVYQFIQSPKVPVMWCGSPLAMQYVGNLMNILDEHKASAKSLVDLMGSKEISKCGLNSLEIVLAEADAILGYTKTNKEAEKQARQLLEKAKIQYIPMSSRGCVFDWYWMSYYEHQLEVDPDGMTKEFLPFVKVARAGIFDYIAFDKVALVCPHPEGRPKVNARGVSHSTEGPAYSWKDGCAFYELDGVLFSESRYWGIINGTLSPEEIIRVTDENGRTINVEERMIAMKYYGIEKLLEKLGAILLDKQIKKCKLPEIEYDILPDGRAQIKEAAYKEVESINELYEVRGVFARPVEYFVKITCQSTGRVYCHCVDPNIVEKSKSAHAGVASLFDLDETSYLTMEVES